MSKRGRSWMDSAFHLFHMSSFQFSVPHRPSLSHLLFINQSIFLTICLFVHLSVCSLSAHLSIYLSFYPSNCLWAFYPHACMDSSYPFLLSLVPVCLIRRLCGVLGPSRAVSFLRESGGSCLMWPTSGSQ